MTTVRFNSLSYALLLLSSFSFYKCVHCSIIISLADRGIGHMMSELMSTNDVERFICSSGGNAGLAVATAAKNVSIPVDVYIPSSTKVILS